KTDAGNGSKAICRVSNVLRSPSPDPERSPEVVGTCRVTVPLWLRFFRFSETAQSEVIYGK
ncbi:MAG: hypothetical protein KDN04_23030, partial [Verrucomicrobiae bacterium]|nr:hypothetical protein [Verrucomicrobiae bacterium]